MCYYHTAPARLVSKTNREETGSQHGGEQEEEEEGSTPWYMVVIRACDYFPLHAQKYVCEHCVSHCCSLQGEDFPWGASEQARQMPDK